MARVILVGYGQMLYSLIEGIEQSGHKILGVFRNDRRHYSPLTLFFKDILAPSMDYTIIKSRKLPEIKARSVNSKKFIEAIKKLKPDLIIVGSWGEKFDEEILSIVRCVNFHPSLLPRNRGANPYFWSIYQNQKVTGLTAHFMDKYYDRGDILAQEAITISDIETGATLKDKTCLLAKAMVGEILNQWDMKIIQPIKQEEKFATYEPQIGDDEKIIDLNKTKIEVDRHLRALTPWASPWIETKTTFLKLTRYSFLSDENFKNYKPYDVIEKTRKYLLIKGADFVLKVYK